MQWQNLFQVTNLIHQAKAPSGQSGHCVLPLVRQRYQKVASINNLHHKSSRSAWEDQGVNRDMTL